MGSFSNQVGQWNNKAKKSYRATARTAVQSTVSLAQRVRESGGRMRVKTGFLRASIQGSIGHMPSGPTRGETSSKVTEYFPVGTQAAGEDISITLLKWDPLTGDSIYVGWTANYARPREYYDGFLRGAVEVWDNTVDMAALKVKNSGV